MLEPYHPPPKRGVLQRIATLLFPLLYAATVLPLTRSFFALFVSADDTVNTVGVHVATIHQIAVPCFLVALEFVGVRTAIAFWQGSRRLSALVLFAACQTLPITAMVTHVIHRDYADLEHALRDAVNATSDRTARARRDEDAAHDRRAADLRRLDGELSTLVDRRESLARAAVALTAEERAAATEPPNLRDRDRVVFIRVQLDRNREEAGEVLRDLRTATAERHALISKGDGPTEAHGNEREPTPLPPFFEYLLAHLWSAKALLAAVVAFVVFTVTILATGFVLTSTEASEHDVAFFSLEPFLARMEGLPVPEQLHLAKQLRPVVATYLENIQTVGRHALAVATFSGEDRAYRCLVEEFAALKGQAASSSAADETKEYLTEVLDRDFAAFLAAERSHGGNGHVEFGHREAGRRRPGASPAH